MMLWNVIMDSKTADFKWFKNLYNSVCEFSKRHKITLHMLKTPEECSVLSDGSIIILLGNNHEWLNMIEKNLRFKNVTVVLMIGYGNFSNNRTISIRYDMNSAIKRSIALLREKGRTKPACFGIQSKDSADLIKADAFSKEFGCKDIYYDNYGMEKCFDDFLNNIEQYDSVICSNDIMALYLLKKCKEHSISIPERLLIVSIGNLWVSSHTSPSITTFDGDMNNMVEVLWKLLEVKEDNELYSNVDVLLEAKIILRESTGDSDVNTNVKKSDRYSPILNFDSDLDREICRIRDLDMVFSSLSSVEIDILSGLVENKSYSEIAAKNFISTDTVKYHIKKIYSRLSIHNRKELADIVAEYSIILKNEM